MITNYFTLRGGFRNWLARLFLQAADKLATAQTLCDKKRNWKFNREWMPDPYPPAQGSKYFRRNS